MDLWIFLLLPSILGIITPFPINQLQTKCELQLTRSTGFLQRSETFQELTAAVTDVNAADSSPADFCYPQSGLEIMNV